MDLVGVAAVVHGRVAEHALQGGVDEIGGLFRFGLCLGLCLGVLVDVGHGRDGVAAGPRARKGGHGGRARGGLGDEGGAAGVHAPEGGARGACAGESAKDAWAGGRLGGRLWAERARLGVVQERLVGALGLVLGDEDAAVAGELEVDLGERAVVGGAQREGGGVQRVGLAVGVVEGAGVGVEQVARVRLLGGRVECGRGRRVGGRALAAAEELAEHVSYRAHAAAMDGAGARLSRWSGRRGRRPGEHKKNSPWRCGSAGGSRGEGGRVVGRRAAAAVVSSSVAASAAGGVVCGRLHSIVAGRGSMSRAGGRRRAQRWAVGGGRRRRLLCCRLSSQV